MIYPTVEDIGRRVIYKAMYDDINEEGTITGVGEYAIYVRFLPTSRSSVACPRACLSWPEKELQKEPEPCPPQNPPTASASLATLVSAPSSGPLPDSELDQRSPSSSTAGSQPNQKAGDASQPESSIKRGIKNGLIDARAADFKLPPIDPTQRAEAIAFMIGFSLCLSGINRALPIPTADVTDLLATAIKLADELYPPFDPTPNPAKRGEDGRRKDGIVMD